MKQFLKYVLATIVGIACISVFTLVLSFIVMGVIAASSDSKPTIKDGTVLRISLSGSITERSNDNPFAKYLGNDAADNQGLDDILKAIKVAKTDERISGIYLEGGVLSTDYATLQELRHALMDFKQSKKFIVAYADSYTQGSYYLASTADKLFVNPSGMIDWHGIASQPIFYTDLLKKVGVKMQVFKVGTYKSAVEPFILTGMSDANREQVQSFVGSIWQQVCKDVAASRRLAVDSLNAYADRYTTFADPKQYVATRLVDSLTYDDGVRQVLRACSKQDKVNFIDPAQLAKLDVAPTSGDGAIAVYYAEGDIVDEAAHTNFSGEMSQIVGSKVVADLDKLANDDKVKAVVLRVNSPGGSAYASEQIWHEVQLLSQEKPVIVSMGAMAASGGYYISCGAKKVFAEPTTLTGSIGIFGMIPDPSELMTEKLGLKFDVVKTNKLSDFGAMGRPLNEAECRMMQAYVNKGYELFTGRVAQGRHMPQDSVKAVAEGRVWTGEQALKIGLVDKLGNLDDAVAAAAKAAHVEKYSIGRYPAPAPWYASLLQDKKADYLDSQLRAALGDLYPAFSLIRNIRSQNPIQARMPIIPEFE